MQDLEKSKKGTKKPGGIASSNRNGTSHEDVTTCAAHVVQFLRGKSAHEP